MESNKPMRWEAWKGVAKGDAVLQQGQRRHLRNWPENEALKKEETSRVLHKDTSCCDQDSCPGVTKGRPGKIQVPQDLEAPGKTLPLNLSQMGCPWRF